MNKFATMTFAALAGAGIYAALTHLSAQQSPSSTGASLVKTESKSSEPGSAVREAMLEIEKIENANREADGEPAHAEPLVCGLKTVIINDGKVEQITHEDGTVQRGASVSNNWNFDGKSIKHNLIGDTIPCGGKKKSRDEMITELSSRFTKNPSLHDMDKQEAKWMANYTSNLMKTNSKCHWLVDASKSIQKKDTFYIDCNDAAGKQTRFWVTLKELNSGASR